MPHWTRPKRQVLATLALVAFTIAPTVYLVGLAVQARRPSHARRAEAALGAALGLTVKVESLRHPRPGEDLYEGVVFTQGEPRGPRFAEVARADLLRTSRADRELRVRAEGLRLRGDGPRQAIEQLAGLLARTGDGTWDRLALLAPSCEVRAGPDDAAFDLRDLVATWHLDRGAPTLSASFLVGQDAEATRCEVVLTRDRHGPSVRQRLKVAVRDGAPLPARALGPFFDAPAWLGPDARVAGTLVLERAEGREWSATFQGELTQVDLDALVGPHFREHRLTGQARLRVASATWGDRGPLGFGWVQADGELTAARGSISRGLLDALARQLAFRVPPSLAPLGPDARFQALGLKFAMTADGGLALKGALSGDHAPDAVLVDGERVLAAAPRGPGDVRGLVNALFPVAAEGPEVLVPGDRAAASVQRYLPAPASLATRP